MPPLTRWELGLVISDCMEVPHCKRFAQFIFQVGRIIGRAGATIKELEMRTGCRIQVCMSCRQGACTFCCMPRVPLLYLAHARL